MAMARHVGPGPEAMKSVGAGAEPVLQPSQVRTSGVPQYLPMSRALWLGAPPSLDVKSRWVVVLVTGTESHATLVINPPRRPRKSGVKRNKQEPKQQGRQASKRQNQMEEIEEEVEEEKEVTASQWLDEPTKKRRELRRGEEKKHQCKKRRKTIKRE